MNKYPKYDLEERTAKLGEDVIALCKTIRQNAITKPLISQFVRSTTSIGANYMEANGAASRRDFANKINICRKEAQESKHHLRMLLSYDSGLKPKAERVEKEILEVILIFGKIYGTLKNKE